MDSGSITLFLVGALLGALGPATAYIQQKRHQKRLFASHDEKAGLQVQAAREEAKSAIKDAKLEHKAEMVRFQEKLENDNKKTLKELQDQKKRLATAEEKLDKRFDQLDGREKQLDNQRQALEERKSEVDGLAQQLDERLAKARKNLETIANMTLDEARSELISEIEEEAKREAGRLVKRLEDDTRAMSMKRAQDIVATAIQRFAGEFVAEHTVSVVTLPTEDMKGRIIGREGRNIRALEAATGCDLIIDDTPEAVVVSGFNPVRRQIAKRSLEELVGDGRIHPARIEEVVRKIRKSVGQEVMEAGEQAIFDLGLHGVHSDLIEYLGMLKFRTSYTQNVLHHSIEVGFFAGIMAEELGLDGDLARRCGLMHDIGKALDHDQNGSHAVIGGQLVKKYKEHPTVVNSVWSHHFDIEPTSVYGPLTNAADALSAARPGARRENVQTYIKRLEALEGIAQDFKGVQKAYAIQAGRELRVIVDYDRLQDEGAMILARDIARRVEDEMTYPGQIKVTVIREMRATEVAQ
ncbi:MAG: ribonuclease Y [Magnetococcales bacterium]|nr:ribonuclease Y [Magnetococcales bacterium]